MNINYLHNGWRNLTWALGLAAVLVLAVAPNARAQNGGAEMPNPNSSSDTLLPGIPAPGTTTPAPLTPETLRPGTPVPGAQPSDADLPATGSPRPEPPHAAATPEPRKANLAWKTKLEGDTVTVEITDATSHYRVDTVELIGPGGIRVPAPELTRLVERSYGTKAVGSSGPFDLDVKGGSSSGVGVGIGIGGPVHSSNVTPPPRTVTRARIQLPDPSGYRANYPDWKISADLIDSEGGTANAEFPAPAP